MTLRRRVFTHLILALALLAALPAHATNLYVALSDRSFSGVAMFTETLGLIDQIEVAGPIGGIAGGNGGTFYISRGNAIVHLADDGSVLGSISGSSTTEVPDLAFDGSELAAAVVDRNFGGIARFNGGLTLLDQFPVGGLPGAVANGPNGTYFTSFGNRLVKVDPAGNVVNSIAASSTILRDIFGSRTTQILDLDFVASVAAADPPVSETPEPVTSALMGAGLAILGVVRVRRRRA